MAVIRCACGTPIEWVRTASGRRLPFDHELVPVGQAPEGNAWTMRMVPLGGKRIPRAVPYRENDHREVKRVLVRHQCEAA